MNERTENYRPWRPEWGIQRPSAVTETQASTGMHSSKMSHQHSSAEGGVGQVSATAVNTLNIGTKSTSFRKGLEGRRGRQGMGAPAPSQSGHGRLQV